MDATIDKYYPNDHLAACYDAKKRLSKRSGAGVTNHSAVSTDMEFELLANRVCVADIMTYGRERATPEYFVQHLMGLDKQGGGRKMLIEYLTERSFLRHAFVFQRDFNVGTGCVVSSCDMPDNYVGLANNVLRLGLENPLHVKRFKDMVRVGLNEDLSFAMSCYRDLVVDKSSGTVLFGKHQVIYGHSVLDSLDNKKFVDTLLGNRSINDCYVDNLVFKDSLGYDSAWCNVGGSVKGYFLKKILSSLKECEVVVPEKRDLLGRVIVKESTHNGYLIKDVNELWESLREQ